MKKRLIGVEKFARRYTVETLTALAILVGAFSAWMHLFIGTLGWSVIFMAAGAILGIFFPSHIDQGIKKIYFWSCGGNRMGEMLMEIGKIAIALFLPFLYFGFLGLMAGTAYHYYTRFVHQSNRGNNSKAA